MSRTVWTIIILIVLAVGIASFIGIRIGHSIGKLLRPGRTLGHVPSEYADLLKRPDSELQFLETIVDQNRNPISRFRYLNKYEILETWLDFSDTGILRDKFNIVQSDIPGMGFTDSYDALTIGTIYVDFLNRDQPDSSFSKVTLDIEGRGFENNSGSDSVLSYFLEQGYFSIGRSRGAVPDIFSSKVENHGWSGSSTSTVLLLKSRGKKVFLLVAAPILEKTKVPQDLLLRLVNDSGTNHTPIR
jgi:hypothetical protein